jgi:hypothetical protein
MVPVERFWTAWEATMTATPEFKEAQEHKRECYGCEKCGKVEGLFSNQHGGIYLCSKCFFETPTGQRWPLPEGQTNGEEEPRMKACLQLTMEEKQDTVKYAKLRAAKKKSKDSKKADPSKERWETDLVGIPGEIIVARFTGGEWDKNIYEGGDEYDVTLPCGCKVGVRTADIRERPAQWTVLGSSKHPTVPPDKPVVGCTLGKKGWVDIRGVWIPGMPYKEDKDFGYGPRAAVLFDDMKGAERLKQHIERCT